MAVFSERFALCTVPGVLVQSQVPPRYRAVIRCVSVANSEATSANVYVIVANRVVWFAVIPALSAVVEGNLRLVYYENAHIGLQIQGGAAVTATLNGYLFRDQEGSLLPPATVSAGLEGLEPAVDPQLPIEGV